MGVIRDGSHGFMEWTPTLPATTPVTPTPTPVASGPVWLSVVSALPSRK